MTTKLAITAIFLFAVVLGVGAIAPAMAAKADAPGQNKVTICHFDEEENKYVQITVPPHAAEKHKEKHGDVEPEADGSCPVIDTTAPVITLIGAETIDVEVDTTYDDEGATALDDIEGDITGEIVTVNPVDVTTVGTYVITYDVMDSSGNAATQVTRTVNVVDPVPPIP